MTLFKPGLNMVYLMFEARPILFGRRIQMQPRSANCSLTSVSQSTPFIKGNKFNDWLPRRRHRGRSHSPSRPSQAKLQQAPAPGAPGGSMRRRLGQPPSSSSGGGPGSMLLLDLLLSREPWKVLVHSSGRMWTGAQRKMLA